MNVLTLVKDLKLKINSGFIVKLVRNGLKLECITLNTNLTTH